MAGDHDLDVAVVVDRVCPHQGAGNIEKTGLDVVSNLKRKEAFTEGPST